MKILTVSTVMMIFLLAGCSPQTNDASTKSNEVILPEVEVLLNEISIQPGTDTNLIKNDKLIIKASSAQKITSIVYRIGDKEIITSKGNEVVLQIPDEYYNLGSFTLNCYAIDEKGNASFWEQYVLNATSGEADSELAIVAKVRPEVLVSSANTVLEPDVNYYITSGNTLKISATHVDGISKVVYRLGTKEEVTVDGSSATILIPEDIKGKGLFSLNCYAITEAGNSSIWQQYLLEWK